jgi:hypothetical protein
MRFANTTVSAKKSSIIIIERDITKIQNGLDSIKVGMSKP